MKLFYDTEFLERGPAFPLELISLGVVAEDGRELYRANADFDPARATPWLRENVLPRLPPAGGPEWKSTAEIARDLRAFVGSEAPEWWGHFAAYDHVLLCQLFGDMTDLPAGWPYFTHDLEQLRGSLGNPDLPPFAGRPHHALDEARWLRQAWRFLKDGRRGPGPRP